jgi:aspartyl-tRNA(Asn)/glutamyl-tRNA(Gln) amidotransferase subunit C
MALTAADMKKIASLARIREPEERLEPLAKEISGILDWIEQLGEVDTDGVEPMTSAVASKLTMRQDVVTEGGDPSRVLSNAPRTDRSFFVVPKVVE